MLEVEVQGGKAQGARHRLPCWRLLLERLAPEERFVRVRGDHAVGHKGVTAEREEIGQCYRFKLRRTAGVRRLIKRLWRRGDWSSVGY